MIKSGVQTIRLKSAYFVEDIIGYPSTTILQAVGYEMVTPLSSVVGLILTFVIPWIIISALGKMHILTVKKDYKKNKNKKKKKKKKKKKINKMKKN
ncbi:MAG: hypothetical protein EZS28_017603 [Streblomastix strix]|uniref:Uncharacterized protein n=1 Tax=Streblomastix strix TaxID=222440 RepID=A0A5J4VWJ2_9EUKA|nr:MAG: hypothetical protein EZS28_017603 [Streblomastix strix]